MLFAERQFIYMKVGILTFHRADNYGAVLQTYALYSQCKEMGYDTEVIDYRCSAIENVYWPIRFPKLRRNMYRWAISAASYLCYEQEWREKAKRFNSFRELFSMSSPHYDTTSKREIEEKYDFIITGSDQIWNRGILSEPNYWYCYKKETESDTKVISYAASVGSLTRFKQGFGDYETVLRDYDAISVRESDVQAYLEEVMDRKVYTVLDPTLIVDKQLWLNLIRHDDNKREKYLVYYDVAQNKVSRKIAGDIARKNKCAIVKFNQIKSPTMNTKYFSDAGPIEFLNCIYNAECIVTSSFHATVFSILFGKKFVAALHPITGERIRSLLTMLGLESRIVYEHDKNIMEVMNQPIDYARVEEKLAALREFSINFLTNALNF